MYGEPTALRPAGWWVRVYPRMYGETFRRVLRFKLVQGLSPHVRGNPSFRERKLSRTGSIPACTGKPSSTSTGSAAPRVYPRMYGETLARCARTSLEIGLSPHVRGNPANAP